MRISTVVVLAVLWSVVLLPGLVRDRRTSPLTTANGFSEAMSRLAGCDSRVVVIPGGSGRRMVVYPRPPARAAILERRRVVLMRLATALVASFVTAGLFGGLAWLLAGTALAALAGYCVALRMLALQRIRARSVVAIHPARVRREAERQAQPVEAQFAVGQVGSGPVESGTMPGTMPAWLASGGTAAAATSSAPAEMPAHGTSEPLFAS